MLLGCVPNLTFPVVEEAEPLLRSEAAGEGDGRASMAHLGATCKDKEQFIFREMLQCSLLTCYSDVASVYLAERFEALQ